LLSGSNVENLHRTGYYLIFLPYGQHGRFERDPLAGVGLALQVASSIPADTLVLARFSTGCQLLAELNPHEEMSWKGSTAQLAATLGPNGGVLFYNAYIF
jgi:hypothetical protein